MNYVSVSLAPCALSTLPMLDPHSRYYQAWFGIYAILGLDKVPFGFAAGRPEPDALAPLLLADQAHWQQTISGHSGEPPRFGVQRGPDLISLPHLAHRAFLFHGTIHCRSVLTTADKQSGTAQRYFPMPNEREWGGFVSAAHDLELSGFAIVWVDRARSVTYCAYGTGACFTDRNGIRHDYARTIEAELLTLVASVGLRRRKAR